MEALENEPGRGQRVHDTTRVRLVRVSVAARILGVEERALRRSIRCGEVDAIAFHFRGRRPVWRVPISTTNGMEATA